MKIIDWDLGSPFSSDGMVIALGNFDGIHIGHQALITRTVEIAREKGVSSAVLLFKNHTESLFGATLVPRLSNLEDKIDRIQSLGIDTVILKTFDTAMAAMGKDAFLSSLRSFRVQHIVTGRDYTFGHKAEGDVSDLYQAERDGMFAVTIVEDVLYEGERISSTRIREALLQGEVERARVMLGAPYHLRGKVVHGARRGHSLGYATANLVSDFPYVLPGEGVYLTRANIDGTRYYGMTSVGTNPTFTPEGQTTVETNLFDFDRSIYDATLVLSFLRYERGNITFETKEELAEQMREDERLLRAWAQDEERNRIDRSSFTE